MNKQELEEGTRRWKKILFAVFDELSSRILAHPLESVCLPLVAEDSFAQVVEYCRYGRSKVVEVFRRLHDGDPVEIEKNFRCSSDKLVV